MTFDKFWAAYPIKKGKVAAQRAWNKLNVDSRLATIIMEAMQAQKQEREAYAKAGQWFAAWPHGSTWLNQRRWEDEITRPEIKSSPRQPPKPSYHELWVRPDWLGPRK